VNTLITSPPSPFPPNTARDLTKKHPSYPVETATKLLLLLLLLLMLLLLLYYYYYY
jgi:hypothetical protein